MENVIVEKLTKYTNLTEACAIEMLSAETIKFYEYYQGTEISYTGSCNQNIVYGVDQDNNQDPDLKAYNSDQSDEYAWALCFVSKYIEYFPKLENLFFISRFPNELTYEFILKLPPNIKRLYLEHTKGFNFDICKLVPLQILSWDEETESYV
jgi:hypothetical protein